MAIILDKWLNVNSTFISAIKYETKTKTIYVRINNKKEYGYPDLSEELFIKFYNAAHPGKFYDEFIKTKSSKKTESNKVLSNINKLINVGSKSLIVKKPGITISQQKPIAINPNDKAMKDVLGTIWGGVQLGLVFAPLPVSTPLRIGIAAASILSGSWLEAKGIEAPLAVDLAIDVAAGYGLYAGLKGIGTRTAKFSGLVKSPFVNVGYKAGVVKASVTPTQAVAGIMFGGNKWKQAIVNMEQKVAATTAARVTAINRITKDFTVTKMLTPFKAPPLPGTSKNWLTPTELKELTTLTEKVYKGRKIGQSEKVLDFMLKNQKNISAGIGGGYTIYETIQDINTHSNIKKDKQKKKRTGWKLPKILQPQMS